MNGKGISMITVMRLGEMVIPSLEVEHTNVEVPKLLGKLNNETCTVAEAIGNYHMSVTCFLHDFGLYVSDVNAMLVPSYGNNSLRWAKTDKRVLTTSGCLR